MKGTKRQKRMVKQLLDALTKELAPLSVNKGPLIHDPKCFISNKKKARKGKGRKRGRIVKPMMKWKEIHEQGLEPREYWNEWATRRDGFKDWPAAEVEAGEREKNKPWQNTHRQKQQKTKT